MPVIRRSTYEGSSQWAEKGYLTGRSLNLPTQSAVPRNSLGHNRARAVSVFLLRQLVFAPLLPRSRSNYYDLLGALDLVSLGQYGRAKMDRGKHLGATNATQIRSSVRKPKRYYGSNVP